MSFSFSVATANPPPLASIVDRIGDKDLRFEEGEEVGATARAWPSMCVHLYRPGVSTRSVEVCLQGDAVNVRLLSCSSPEEYELGMRFLRATAELAGAGVRPEDAGELAVDELEKRYGAEWAARQVCSAALAVASFARQGRRVTIPGPIRDFYLGQRLLAELSAGAPEEEDEEELFVERLLGAIRRTQYVDPERYYEASEIEVDAGGGSGAVRVAVWTPSSIGHLFTPADYVFLTAREKDGGEMLVVPFAAVPEIAGDRCAFLDEVQLLVEPVSEKDWPQLAERAEKHGTELP
ncbi:MAG TPA: hypothetical protein VF486_12100 [Actinomycetes bacterium]